MRKSEKLYVFKSLNDIEKIEKEYFMFVQKIRKNHAVEEIEGFNDLSEIEQEYLRFMQGEDELRMQGHYFQGKFEIVTSLIMFSVYIILCIRENYLDMSTFSAAMIVVADLVWLYEDFFE